MLVTLTDPFGMSYKQIPTRTNLPAHPIPDEILGRLVEIYDRVTAEDGVHLELHRPVVCLQEVERFERHKPLQIVRYRQIALVCPGKKSLAAFAGNIRQACLRVYSMPANIHRKRIDVRRQDPEVIVGCLWVDF